MNTSKDAVEKQLNALSEKLQDMDQPLDHQLEGVVHAKPINYWDYIQTDALLNLQVQRTLLPDEMVFIMYHQVNELIFKMILWELQQVADKENLDTNFYFKIRAYKSVFWHADGFVHGNARWDGSGSISQIQAHA